MSYLKIKIDDNFSKPLAAKLKQAGPRVAHTLAQTIQKDTEPFVPARNKALVNSTQVVESMIIYPGPYARYLYYGKVMVFKAPPYLRTVNGKEVLSHYGQKKVPIDKELNIRKSTHAQATDHWLEASKAQNLEKWIHVAGKTVERELGK